ncbi:hypothetical protein CspeluHIS016_0300760 [Cutaneotrichosporon spelunceum]|uniref:Cytochrome oxidase assembly n=1 Tax=Cutaneotrichosporon spelunceum TaxID=1672016 RepID=A0AAD3TTJ3_9TREE|nr:hypothetical protein CspeluHIS016_0300760 [Cutaneotrichosporon spelunceum]
MALLPAVLGAARCRAAHATMSPTLRMLSTSTLRARPTFPATASALGLKASSAAPPRNGFFAQSYLPYGRSFSFFTPSRYASTSAPAAAAAAPEAPPAVEDERVIPRFMPAWLLGCSALVFAIIVIGGLTRLTESGLSITEWNPITGIRPPLTEAEWDIEWDKYRKSPEGILINSDITRSDFKFIFYMEWAHRIAGRALGVLYIVPAVYYCTRYKLPRGLPTTLIALGAGIGLQGLIGWLMVASGLREEIVTNKEVARVSQYRLAAHFGAAVLLYMGMFYTGLALRRDRKHGLQIKSGAAGAAAVEKLATALNSPAVKRYRGFIYVLGAMAFITAISGAFVAGLDAGLIYNEFPYMGEGFHPPKEELLDPRYSKDPDRKDIVWRNMLENPVTAQFDHRVLAVTTATLLIVQHLIARRPSLRLGENALPRSAQRWSAWTAAAALGQVSLGIGALIYLVPLPLAASHQAGAVVVITCIMGLTAAMRRPGRALQALRQAAKSKSQLKPQPKE